MATWFDLPREIKLAIFELVFDTPFIKYKPRDLRLKRDKAYESSLRFRALYLVSKNFAHPDELNAALLRSSTLVFCKATQIRRMISEMPISSTSNVRQVEFRNGRLPIGRFGEEHNTLRDLQVTHQTFGTYMPDLKKVIVSSPYQPINIGEIIHLARPHDVYHYRGPDSARSSPEDTKALAEITDYLLAPGAETPNRVVKEQTKRSFHSVAYRFMSRKTATPRSNPKRRVWPWINRLVNYCASKGIEVVFQISCQIEITYVYPNSFLAMNACRPYVGLGTMSTDDWVLRLKHNDQEYQFYQDSARQLFPHEDILVQ